MFDQEAAKVRAKEETHAAYMKAFGLIMQAHPAADRAVIKAALNNYAEEISKALLKLSAEILNDRSGNGGKA